MDTGGWRQWVSKEALMFKVQELRIEPGVRYMRQTLLLLDIFTWATNVMFWQTSFYAMLAVWSCRCAVLLVSPVCSCAHASSSPSLWCGWCSGLEY